VRNIKNIVTKHDNINRNFCTGFSLVHETSDSIFKLIQIEQKLITSTFTNWSYFVTDISMQQLERKERLCRELLLLLVNLGAGQCRMRG